MTTLLKERRPTSDIIYEYHVLCKNTKGIAWEYLFVPVGKSTFVIVFWSCYEICGQNVDAPLRSVQQELKYKLIRAVSPKKKKNWAETAAPELVMRESQDLYSQRRHTIIILNNNKNKLCFKWCLTERIRKEHLNYAQHNLGKLPPVFCLLRLSFYLWISTSSAVKWELL